MSAECRLTVTVRPARDADEIEAAKDLRVRVFCGEQGVDPDEELDGLDPEATHIVALDEKAIVATCRLRFLEEGCKLERMAVDPRARGLGVGTRLLSGAEGAALDSGATEIVLNAQTRARGFYEGSGYRPEGGLFMEADIEHVRMVKTLGGEGSA